MPARGPGSPPGAPGCPPAGRDAPRDRRPRGRGRRPSEPPDRRPGRRRHAAFATAATALLPDDSVVEPFPAGSLAAHAGASACNRAVSDRCCGPPCVPSARRRTVRTHVRVRPPGRPVPAPSRPFPAADPARPVPDPPRSVPAADPARPDPAPDVGHRQGLRPARGRPPCQQTPASPARPRCRRTRRPRAARRARDAGIPTHHPQRRPRRPPPRRPRCRRAARSSPPRRDAPGPEPTLSRSRPAQQHASAPPRQHSDPRVVHRSLTGSQSDASRASAIQARPQGRDVSGSPGSSSSAGRPAWHAGLARRPGTPASHAGLARRPGPPASHAGRPRRPRTRACPAGLARRPGRRAACSACAGTGTAPIATGAPSRRGAPPACRAPPSGRRTPLRNDRWAALAGGPSST